MIDLNEQFQEAIRNIEHTNNNLFITGKAGTGKSFFLDYCLNNIQKQLILLATTGVSAINIGGQTIHSFFGFPLSISPERIHKKQWAPRDPKKFNSIEAIVIDEASMLRPDLLDCVDALLQHYGPELDTPFGGVQMIFVGDLFQLPPVVLHNEKESFYDNYDTPYFFSAKALLFEHPKIIEFTHVYRQSDPDFISLLNRIRDNSLRDGDIAELNKRYSDSTNMLNPNDSAIVLATTNKVVDRVNGDRLKQLEGELYVRQATIEGTVTTFPSKTQLEFKIGSQIMLLTNHHDGLWGNGDLAIIEAIGIDEDNNEYISITLLRQQQSYIKLYPHSWPVYNFKPKTQGISAILEKEQVGTFKQYPFQLAWAITIHKSQGKTFERVIIDFGKGSFATGQVYTALSRCKSLQGIQFSTPLKRSYVFSNDQIYDFLNPTY